jgi:hypothetical protein
MRLELCSALCAMAPASHRHGGVQLIFSTSVREHADAENLMKDTCFAIV